jgi:hypothetical protein
MPLLRLDDDDDDDNNNPCEPEVISENSFY